MATFTKDERLCGRNDISRLLAEGTYGYQGCLKYCVLKRCTPKYFPAYGKGDFPEFDLTEEKGSLPARLLVSVPKRIFKRAVKRNLLKRRMRESFRLLKHRLGEYSGIDLMLIFNSREVASFKEIHSDVEAIINKIVQMQDTAQL